MPTSYELKAELKALCKGEPRFAISTLKKHELEAHVEVMRKRKAEFSEAVATKVQAKPGPLGPRKIAVEEVADGDATIRIPKAPAPRISGRVPNKVSFTPEPEPETSKEPVREVKDIKVVRSGPVTIHFCNCPDCPNRRK
jgi:hypothetical protein